MASIPMILSEMIKAFKTSLTVSSRKVSAIYRLRHEWKRATYTEIIIN